MKRNVLTILLALALVLLLAGGVRWYNSLSAGYGAAGGSSGAEDASAEPAPDFTVLDREGEEHQLSESFGKPLVVNFWATWCGPCRSELPAFDKLCQEYGDQVQFMMVNMTDGYRDTVEKVEAFLDEEGYSFPVYFDTEYAAAQAYNVYSLPYTVFIDKDGTVSASHLGALSEEKLKAYIEEIVSNEK